MLKRLPFRLCAGCTVHSSVHTSPRAARSRSQPCPRACAESEIAVQDRSVSTGKRKVQHGKEQQSQAAIQRFNEQRAASAEALPAAGEATGARRHVASVSLPLIPPGNDPDRVYALIAPPEKRGARRVRHHVNPFKPELQQPDAVEWGQVFEDPRRPLIVDIGSASGRFLLAVAAHTPDYNLLGLEIRKQLVERANGWSATLGVTSSVHFRVCNATVNFERILENYPGRLDLTMIQCPDPQFKARNHKRRIVQPALAAAIARRTAPGGAVYMSSDVLEVAEDMRSIFHAHTRTILHVAPEHGPAQPKPPAASLPVANSAEDGAQPAHPSEASDDQGGAECVQEAASDGSSAEAVDTTEWREYAWLQDNPLGLVTEREQSVLKLKQGDMYRMLLRKPVDA